MATDLGVHGDTITVLEHPATPLPPREPKTYTFAELREIFEGDGIIPSLLDEIDRLREIIDSKDRAAGFVPLEEALAERQEPDPIMKQAIYIDMPPLQSADPEIIPWERLRKMAERDGVAFDDYIASMNAHILNQRDEIKRLRADLAIQVVNAKAVTDLQEQLAKLRTWRLIQNAPHPGVERVLLWFPELGYAVSGFNEAYSYRSGGWKATHWMPLPARPAVDVPADVPNIESKDTGPREGSR